ncbi:MAG: B12-binding domain-containing radical SAM protein [Myxococcales bacterium]|nr:B12-binding domain-containing radical SAM protein [Myxococcales bacterium]
MRFLLVGPDLESNLSLGYLSSSLMEAGHEARIHAYSSAADGASVREAAKSVDVVGLSLSFQWRAPEFLELARALKADRPTRPVIAGGHFASCAATELLRDNPALDLIVLHEAERSLVELAALGGSMLERASEVPGVVFRQGEGSRTSSARASLSDLDSLPFPDRSGPARLVAGVPTAYLMASRGCIRNCDYCCITTLHRMVSGARFRRRDPEKVAEELAHLYYRRGVRQFVFHDDNFLVPSPEKNRERLARFSRAIESAGLRDIGIVMKCGPQDLDRASLETLRSMGLLRIFLGIESGSQRGLDSIGRRQTSEDTERAVSLCEEYGVSSQYTMITFHPEATIESMLADLDFVERHPAHPLNYCRAELYAGTPLERRMLDSGRALGTYMARTYRYEDPRVARVWAIGRDLFAGRAWGKDEILGRAIRFDHQVAVLDHFYRGPEVARIVRDFRAWEVALNLETASLFRELVLACGEARSDDAPALRSEIESIRRRERRSREAHLQMLCSLRERIDAIVMPVVAFATNQSPATKLPRRMPRHAAAVLVAAGLIGCGGGRYAADDGVAEAAPPPYDESVGGEVHVGPMDAGVQASDGGPRRYDLRGRDAGISDPDEQRFLYDDGVAEAAPPPYDDRLRMDDGVAEAAPPPLEDEID